MYCCDHSITEVISIVANIACSNLPLSLLVTRVYDTSRSAARRDYGADEYEVRKEMQYIKLEASTTKDCDVIFGLGRNAFRG